MREATITPSTLDVQRVLDSPKVLHTELQPIVDVQAGRIVGHEALSRFIPGNLYGPVDWFTGAREAGLGTALEAKACRAALTWLPRVPADQFISVNLSPEALHSQEIRDQLLAVDPARLVVELTELADSTEEIHRAGHIDELRGRGVRLAIDDIGAGHAGIRRILTLCADLLKIDRALVDGCATDPMLRHVLEFVVSLAHKQGGEVVAEGVEGVDDLRAVHDIGIRFAQGYLLGRPAPQPAELTDDQRRALEWVEDNQQLIELCPMEQGFSRANSAVP